MVLMRPLIYTWQNTGVLYDTPTPYTTECCGYDTTIISIYKKSNVIQYDYAVPTPHVIWPGIGGKVLNTTTHLSSSPTAHCV